MKGRNVFGLMVFIILSLLLAAGSGVARESRGTTSAKMSNTNAWGAANAPWFIIAVDTIDDRGQYASVAIDPANDDTYISYYDATNEHLRLAYDNKETGNCDPDNSWTCGRRDLATDGVGKYNSIAIDPIAGEEGIAFYHKNGKLKYFDPSPGYGWITLTIDEGIYPTSYTGRYTSLKYRAADGVPFIAYQFVNDGGVDALMLAHFVGSSGNCGIGAAEDKWQCDTIILGEGVGQYASLALDDEGYAHIAYYDAGKGELWYATSRSGTNCGPGNSWTCYRVSRSGENAGQYASIYVDAGKRFHIAYYNATADMLEYAYSGSLNPNCGYLNKVRCDKIDDMPTGTHPVGVDMAEDAAGYPIIAYQSKHGSLNVARPAAALGKSGGDGNCGPGTLFFSWYCETVHARHDYFAVRHGDYVSIDVSSSGLATIAYYGFITSSGGNLRVAYQQHLQEFLPLVVGGA